MTDARVCIWLLAIACLAAPVCAEEAAKPGDSIAWETDLPKAFAAAKAQTLAAIGHQARNGLGIGRHSANGEGGFFARSWPIGLTALWIAVLLSVYILLYYLS